MKKILLIKTSSLGDVVHNFPALSDIKAQFPNASVDWVVEEAYLPLVRMHPGVRRAIPVAVRRWRGRPLKQSTWGEMAEFRRILREERFDAIIDTQGLIKSAVLAAAAHGRRHGLDSASARESIAARFYDVRHHVARAQHAVARNRELAAKALGYRCLTPVRYGLTPRRLNVNESRVVFLHSTSKASKLWPEARWVALGQSLVERGLQIVLPWGRDSECDRSKRIAQGIAGAEVPPALGLEAMAELLAGCHAVVGVDTGLTHLAAALDVPVVAIYGATDPALTGVYGARRAVNVGGADHLPEVDEVLQALTVAGAG
jgi:heptosyltransferase I